MAYELVEPTLIANTTMKKYINSAGVFKQYLIYPNEGYVLHDNAGSWTDPNTNVHYEAYYSGSCSCGANYDFANTTTIDGYTAHGPREFFARPASEVPDNQIFGLTPSEPEVI